MTCPHRLTCSQGDPDGINLGPIKVSGVAGANLLLTCRFGQVTPKLEVHRTVSVWNMRSREGLSEYKSDL